LYSSDVPFHIYGTFQYPERYYGVAFTFSNDIRIDVSSFDNLRELKVILLADSTFVNSRLLIIQLLHPHSRDIFASLCENLIQSVILLNTEQKISNTVVNQLEKWTTLLKKQPHRFNTFLVNYAAQYYNIRYTLRAITRIIVLVRFTPD
jgi:hypothetical protein